jgi:hypothetical protein
MEGQQAICGVAVETNCPTIEIKDIPAIDFQLTYLDALADILKLSVVPKITPSLFIPIETITAQVVIVPTEINNLHQVTQARAFGIRLDLYSNHQTIEKAYGEVLSMIKIIINALTVLNNRYGLTYSVRLGIINSGQSTLFLTLNKTV